MAVAGTFLVAAASLVGFFEVPLLSDLCIALFALSTFLFVCATEADG